MFSEEGIIINSVVRQVRNASKSEVCVQVRTFLKICYSFYHENLSNILVYLEFYILVRNHIYKKKSTEERWYRPNVLLSDLS